jgi:mannonate dehydratase
MPSDDWTRTALDVPDRGGALCTAFDVRERSEQLAGQTLQSAPSTPASTLWRTLEAFLREVLPVCEECNVRLALHPDDPPLAMLHGKPQIVYSVDEMERVVKLVDSPANGLCFCQGTFASAGVDVPSAIRRLGKAIKFVHSRNVVHEPVEGLPAGSKFRETWQDTGDIDMAEAYRAYHEVFGDASGVVVRPDHVPTLVGENNEVPGYHVLGRLFALGYLKGLMEAVQTGRAGSA